MIVWEKEEPNEFPKSICVMVSRDRDNNFPVYGDRMCYHPPPQRSAITEFGEATALFAQLATSELHQMRDAVVAMNVSRLVLEGTAANPDLTNLDEQFDPEVVKARVEAA